VHQCSHALRLCDAGITLLTRLLCRSMHTRQRGCVLAARLLGARLLCRALGPRLLCARSERRGFSARLLGSRLLHCLLRARLRCRELSLRDAGRPLRARLVRGALDNGPRVGVVGGSPRLPKPSGTVRPGLLCGEIDTREWVGVLGT